MVRTRYLRALIAVIFIAGTAGITYFVSNRLSSSQSVTPNAPESNPQAYVGQKGGPRLPDEDLRDIQRGTSNGATPPKTNKPIPEEDAPTPKPTAFQTPVGISNGAGQSTPAPTQKPASPTSAPDNQANYQPPQNTGGGSGGNNPTPIKTPTPYFGANIPTPTTKAPTSITPTIAENRFGYRPPDTTNVPEYMKPENNKCKDGFGFVSGTLCVTNPITGEVERRIVNNVDTLKASKDAVANARSLIENKSDEELLQIAAQNGKTCGNSDLACQQRTIQQITEKLLTDNAVFITKDMQEIKNAREKNQVTFDARNLSTEEFKKKYSTPDVATTLQQKGITNPTELAAVNFLLTAYKESKTPATDIIEYICKGNLTCKKELKTENINNLLKQAVGDKISTSDVEAIIKNKNYQAKSQTYTDLFLNQSMSDKDKVDKYCKDEGIDLTLCRKNVDVNDLAIYAPDPKALIQLKTDYSTQRIISDPNNDIKDLAKIYCSGKTADCTTGKILSQIKDETIRQSTNDQLLSKFYMDIQNNTNDLAAVYCGASNKKCISEFSKENLLSAIKDPNVQQFAQNNRNSQLFQYIVPLKTNQAVDIDNDTKREVERLDIDFQHAYWAYWKEQTQKQKLTASTVDNDKLGEDFYKLFASNPAEFNKYLSQYNANPKLFTDIQVATAYKAGTDINSSIIALSNQAVKTSPIKGLFDGNKVVTWNQASDEYKDDARKLACANDKSIAIYCSAMDGYASRRITEEQRDNALAQIDATIARSNKQTAYLEQVYQDKITNNLPSSFYSNTVAIDNFTVPQEIRLKAVEDAKNQITNQLYNQAYSVRGGGGQQYINQATALNNTSYTDFLNGQNIPKQYNLDILEEVNKNIEQSLVTETYTRGGGVVASLAAAGLATAACSALGPGAAFCGAVGGLAGAISTYIPILGTVTAEEMAAEKQKLQEFEIFGQNPFQNESVSGIVQSLYSSQGAACDVTDNSGLLGTNTSIGGSCTRKDNQYANYQSMLNTYGQYGANLNALGDTNFVYQLAIQGTINQQFDALQRESQNQAIANIIVAPIIGAASGGIGGKLAQSSAAINNPSYTQALLRQQANDWALWLPGSAVGTLQNYAQFDATTGFIDTQSEIDLEICVREKGRDKCNDKQKIVDDETNNAMKTTLLQGFLTDAALQVGQSGFSFATQYAQIASQNPNTPPPGGSNSLNQTRPTDPDDSSFVSPQLARELNNIDPRILANTDPAIITAVTDSLRSPSRNGVTDNTAIELNMWQDVGLISEDYILNQLANQRSQGPLTPQEQNIINTIRESNLRRPEGVESLAADIARRSTLSETELAQSLVDRGYTDKEINIAKAIKTNSDPLAEFIKDPTMSNFLLLDDHIQAEATRLGITGSQYLEIASRYQEMYTQTNIPEDIAGLITYIKEQPQTATTPQDSTTSNNNQRITLEEITSIPTEFLNGLTPNERTQLDNLVTAINNSTNDNQRATFQKVLKQQIDSYLAGESNTQLLTTPANPDLPATYESLVSAPRELFTDQQLSDIDNLIISVQNAKTESERVAFTEVLRQKTNSYLNDGFQTSDNFIIPTTDFTEGNQSYLLTLAKDLNVDTTSKSETQIRRALKQEMNKRVFGNENGPTDPTGNTEIRGIVFRDSEGNVLSKDFYWRPEEFADPFVFTKEQADAVFANSKNWRFKPDKTYEAKYNSFLEKTFISNEGPTTVNGFTIRNSKGQSLDEFGKWRRSFFGFDSGHIFTVDEIKNLNLKIRALADDPLTIQSVEYRARPRSTSYQEEYTYTDLMKQEALKEAIIQYNSDDTAITNYLKEAGYTNEEIKYAVDNRKLSESQKIISSLREFNDKANSEFTNAIENTPRNSSFIAAINGIEDRLLSQRQELLNSGFNNLPSTSLVALRENTSPEILSQTPKQPAPISLNDTVNQFANDNTTRVVNRLSEINGNYRVVFNDVVGDANNANAQLVRLAQEKLNIVVEGKTMQEIALEVISKQNQARTIPLEATIKEVDADGNLKYTLDGLSGVTLIADKNSPEAIANKGQNTTNIVGKRAKEIDITIPNKSPIDELGDNTNLPNNLKSEISTKYDSDQIAEFNAKLNDPNYKPKENPLVKIIRKVGLSPREITPEIMLLNKAARLTDGLTGKSYDITTRSLSQIAADIRAVENQFGANKNQTTLTPTQVLKSLEYLPRRFVQGVAEALKISPNAKVVKVDVPAREHRYVGAKYMYKNQEWSDFLNQTRQKLNNISESQMPQSRKDAIISGIEEFFMSRLKSSIVKANPDFKISPKAIDQDTFIDMNPSRAESLELLRSYFDNFESEISTIISQVNKVLQENGTLRVIEEGKYVDLQIQKDWGLALSLNDLRPSKFVFMGLSLDPEVNSYFNVVNNKEAYFIANGTNNEILNAVFMYKILDEPNVNLDDTFPVIEQVLHSNDPDAVIDYIRHYDPLKDFQIYGKPLNKNEIQLRRQSDLIGRQESDFQVYLSSLSKDVVNKLANYNYDSGLPADALATQLDIPNRKRVENAIGSTPVEMVFQEGTDLSFNNTAIVSRNTSQVANDIAGFSLTTDTLTSITRNLPPAEAEEYFEGFHIIYGTVQNEGTILMHGLADIKTYEHAGDGFRGTLDGKLNLEAIKKLVDYSSIYKKTLDRALNGELGPKAQKTATALFKALGDRVYLKVGIGTGDTLFQYLPGNIEVKSSVNVDEYLDNVKKYINQEKAANRTPPTEIIGVSKSISDQFSDQDFATVGLKRIIIEKFNGDKTAYFIVKQTENFSTQSTTNKNVPIKILSIEQTLKQESALRYVTQHYATSDSDLTLILKGYEYSDAEIEYALSTRKSPEIQKVIRELKLFDYQADLEMTNALHMILEVGPSYDVDSVQKKLKDQRKALFDREFKYAQATIKKVDQSTNQTTSRSIPESVNNPIKSAIQGQAEQLLYPVHPLNSMLLPPIPDFILNLFRSPQQTQVVNNNSPITIRNIELILSPKKNQQFTSSIDTSDQFNSRYNKATIYYDKNGQIVGFGDISKLNPITQESILNGQYFKTSILIPKDDTNKYMITEVQETKNIVAHKIITETIELLNNKETAIALLVQTGRLDNVLLAQRTALRRYVSGLTGAIIGMLLEDNFSEEIKQEVTNLLNITMSPGTLSPPEYQNLQISPTVSAPTTAPSPTIQITPTPAPKTYTLSGTDITSDQRSVYSVISDCQVDNQADPNGIAQCFCNRTDNCQSTVTKEIRDRILTYFSSLNMAYNTESLIYITEPIIGVNLIDPNTGKANPFYCPSSQKQICDQQNQPKYITCDPITAGQPFPGDIIVDKYNNAYACLSPSYIPNTGEITCKTYAIEPASKMITDQSSVSFTPDTIKEVWRSANYKDIDTSDKCWKQ